MLNNISLGFPGGLDGKESTRNVGDLGSITRLGRSPGGGHGKPFQYSGLENLHGLVGSSPWGHMELETTEQLSKQAQHNISLYLECWTRAGVEINENKEEIRSYTKGLMFQSFYFRTKNLISYTMIF